MNTIHIYLATLKKKKIYLKRPQEFTKNIIQQNLALLRAMASSTALSCFKSSSLRELADFFGTKGFGFEFMADSVGDKGRLGAPDEP